MPLCVLNGSMQIWTHIKKMLIPPCCHTPVSASNVLLSELRGNVPQLCMMYSGLFCRIYVTSRSLLHSFWITCWDSDMKRVPLHLSLLDAASFFQCFQVAWNAALILCINIQRKDCVRAKGGSVLPAKLGKYHICACQPQTPHHPAEALWPVWCRNVCTMPMLSWAPPPCFVLIIRKLMEC